MKQDQIATASPNRTLPAAVCRGSMSERKRELRLVVEPSPTCAPRVTREYMPPWVPVVGGFVRCENGWGEKIRAEIVRVPGGPDLHSFGVRLFAWQVEGPYLWLSMSTRWALWREEA